MSECRGKKINDEARAEDGRDRVGQQSRAEIEILAYLFRFQRPEDLPVLEQRRKRDDDPQKNERDSDPERQVLLKEGLQRRGFGVDEQFEPFDQESERHKGQAGPVPRQEGALGGEQHPRVFRAGCFVPVHRSGSSLHG